MELLQVPISIGELVDKITILEIKTRRLAGEARRNSERELCLLRQILSAADLAIETEQIEALQRVNDQLWQIEDEIRGHERRHCFDERFIELARAIYRQNDLRAALKRQINLQHGSELVEEKSYEAY